MTKPFKVGERVRVYSGIGPNYHGAIVDIVDGLLEVKVHTDTHILFHPKQCRRLRKKKRLEGFIWVSDEYGPMSFLQTSGKHLDISITTAGKWVRFIEAKEKK